ncbi:MAG: hypothetical protein WDA29_11295 [Flavobacteriaceae bacterium]
MKIYKSTAYWSTTKNPAEEKDIISLSEKIIKDFIKIIVETNIIKNNADLGHLSISIAINHNTGKIGTVISTIIYECDTNDDLYYRFTAELHEEYLDRFFAAQDFGKESRLV